MDAPNEKITIIGIVQRSKKQRAESREKRREQSEELQLQAQQRPTNKEKPF